MSETHEKICIECCDMPLREFTIHVRSFHPEKSFGLGGLFYKGDNRGYSAALKKPDGSTVTARIRSHIRFSTEHPGIAEKDAISDPSAWLLGDKFVYTKDTGPKINAQIPQNSIVTGNCTRMFTIRAHHWGINRALALPRQLVDILVPALDVFYDIHIQIDRKRRKLVLTISVNGDGFPNTEAFIVDERGKSVFLGAHQRVGIPLGDLAGTNHRSMFSCTAIFDLDGDGYFDKNIQTIQYISNTGTTQGGWSSIDEWNKRFEELDPSTPLREIEDHDLSTPVRNRILDFLNEIFGAKPAY